MSIATTLNAMDAASARAALTNCCAAGAWVEGMLAGRPFADDADVLAAASAVAATLTEADWLEAFAAHPLIGDVATKDLAAGEQSGVDGANEATLSELAALNRQYAERFGFIFIVCATGKSAAEMLAILKGRIGNTRDEELKNAAREQLAITRLRLQKLADPGDNT
ncbi:MAG: 2-oxo-4-hydroxy-4-carboxy-5-ureidoimidazoline decarboxylase [Pirellulales bacterium]|nr:2-oxo-4-hydroxy-4-carboxy-5-ureidoimidazoline decarboxylase [Pirellulales bacterium]